MSVIIPGHGEMVVLLLEHGNEVLEELQVGGGCDVEVPVRLQLVPGSGVIESVEITGCTIPGKTTSRLSTQVRALKREAAYK